LGQVSQAFVYREARWMASVSEADLLRLKALARLHARGLPGGIEWSDLFHEALARVLEGKRRKPENVEMVPFVAEVMRSIRNEHWRRAQREVPGAMDTIVSQENPERRLAAAQALAALDRLFADDKLALQIMAGLGVGLTPEEIRQRYGMTPTEYDSVRKRMRRKLLRDGFAWRPFDE